jgi:hypothetical protein
MKYFSSTLRTCGALALMVLMSGCTSAQQQTENMLATAGFRNVLADTPQRKQLLASLPAGKMSTVLKDGKTWYVFPNQATNSAFVGSQQQYTLYRQLLFAQNISDQNLMAAQMNQQANWGAWGGSMWGGPGMRWR